MKKLLTLTALLVAILASPQIAFAADNQAPSVELKPWASTTFGDTLFADVNASDDDRVTKVEYAIDDKVVRTALAPNFDVYIDLTGLTAETHNLKAKAYDPAGNVGITRPRNFTIDRTGPEITINGPEITNAANPQFSFSSPSPDYGQAGCIVQDRGPDQDYFDCSKDVPFASGKTLPDGEWQFVVHARDLVNNPTTARHLFVVDRTAPELAITAGPADGSTVVTRKVSYAWTARDAHGAKQYCSLDGAAPAACESGIELNLAKGPHTFELTATDEAGNVSRLARRVVVDPGTGPDPDPDPDPVRDRKAPVIVLAAVKQKPRALNKGLKVKVTCSEACAGRLVAKPVKRGGPARGIKFTGRASLTSASTVTVRLKPTAKARKKLKETKKPFRLNIVARLADPSGNTAEARLKTKSLR